MDIVNKTVQNNTHIKYFKESANPYYDFNNIYDPTDSNAVTNGGLENGKTYYYRFMTFGRTSSSSSEYSDFLPILCLATPTFEITDPKNHLLIVQY